VIYSTSTIQSDVPGPGPIIGIAIGCALAGAALVGLLGWGLPRRRRPEPYGGGGIASAGYGGGAEAAQPAAYGS